MPHSSDALVKNVTILGSGGMGTACAVLLAEPPDRSVRIWTRHSETAARIDQARENARLLAGIPLTPNIAITADITDAVKDTELIVAAIPTAYLRSTLQPLAASIPSGVPVVSVVKGLENGTFRRPSEILTEVLGERGLVALCGPSHAEEFARRLPCSVVAASIDIELAERVQTLFSTDRFRVYTNRDIVGVELAAALKNVIAIAAGICDGLKFGDNAKAALLTRGIVEITRFGIELGAEIETFSGLAGIGDLITTCYSRFGRNRRVGERLGQGVPLPQIIAELHGVAEGVTTCRSVHELALQKGLDLPIIAGVYRVLFEGLSPLAATNALMMRPPKAESRA